MRTHEVAREVSANRWLDGRNKPTSALEITRFGGLVVATLVRFHPLKNAVVPAPSRLEPAQRLIFPEEKYLWSVQPTMKLFFTFDYERCANINE